MWQGVLKKQLPARDGAYDWFTTRKDHSNTGRELTEKAPAFGYKRDSSILLSSAYLFPDNYGKPDKQ